MWRGANFPLRQVGAPGSVGERGFPVKEHTVRAGVWGAWGPHGDRWGLPVGWAGHGGQRIPKKVARDGEDRGLGSPLETRPHCGAAEQPSPWPRDTVTSWEKPLMEARSLAQPAPSVPPGAPAPLPVPQHAGGSWSSPEEM